MIAEKTPALRQLTPEERLILAGELWEEAAARAESFPVRPDHCEIVQSRLEHSRQHPEEGIAWEEVKARALRSR